MIRFVLLLLFSLSAFANPTPFATARADTIQALVNQYSTLFGYHFVFVYNDSNLTNQFTYFFRLCAPFNGCSTETYQVSLYPHTAAQVNGISALNAIFTRAGTYTVTASSGIISTNINVLATGNTPIQILLH